MKPDQQAKHDEVMCDIKIYACTPFGENSERLFERISAAIAQLCAKPDYEDALNRLMKTLGFVEQDDLSTVMNCADIRIRRLTSELQSKPDSAGQVPVACQDKSIGRHACKNKTQCWEPCGELGHSAEHAKRCNPETERQINDAIAGIPSVVYLQYNAGWHTWEQVADEHKDDDKERIIPFYRNLSDAAPLNIAQQAPDTLTDGAAKRLRLICKLLGLENAIPDTDVALWECVFSALGMVRSKIEDYAALQSQLSQAKEENAQLKALLPLKNCAAGRDGECAHNQCPQLRDGEPIKSVRRCPLDNMEE